MSPGFVHLHVASGYSLKYAASTPAALVARAVDLGQGALALTDRDGLYGAVRFVNACREHGVGPILGVDLAVVQEEPVAPPGSPAAPDPGPRGRQVPARGGQWVPEPHTRVVLLARPGRGWSALCRLVSAAHAGPERGRPRIRPAQIAAHAEGLVLLLGAHSDIGRAVARRRPDLADAALRRWRGTVGADRVRILVESHHGADPQNVLSGVGGSVLPDLPLSSAGAARLYRWARERGVGTVLGNAVRYADRGSAPVVDILDAVRRLVPLDARHIDRANGEGALKPAAQMLRTAQEITRLAGYGDSDAERLLADTVDLGMSCVLDPMTDLGMGEVYVPELDIVAPGRRDADALLRSRCEEALRRRGDRGADAATAGHRLEQELRTIATLGFAGYFLTVAGVVDLIREMGVRVAARGSGAGSFVNHLLGISGVDPLQYDLVMERFLSPLRRTLPDIDIDVESARRTEIYQRILDRFGDRRCAMVSMMDTYRVRHAVRDVGAALGMPPGEIDAFAKAFPHIRARDARAAIEDLPELRASGLGRMARRGDLERFLTLVESLDGLPRHIAMHPCGVLLSDATLLDRTPVEASGLGFPMSQFDKDDVEEMGLLKLDVLGIRMQSAIAHAEAEIARVDGPAAHGAGADGRVRVDDIPLDDPGTFTLIRSTRTLGCFQIESPGQRELIGKFGPKTFNDIIIDISLFRPGPVKSDMVTPFLRARQGWSTPQYLHPDLRPALAETEGVVVFHEQVMRIVAVMTGCSLAEADEVRRTLGSPDGQDEVRVWFYPAALRRGYDPDTVDRVWDVLMAFASFGFCKAHAAAFALPTYQSAWLKAHHPAAFLAGVLTHDPGMYPKRLILDDARNAGVAVLGLDVNRSDAVYRVERAGDGHGIRLALGEVKGISAEEVDSIVAGRPYRSLADFWRRTGVSRPTAEALIRVGAFDATYGIAAGGGPRRRGGVTRRDLLLQVADLDRRRATVTRLPPGQLALDLADDPTVIISSGLPEMDGTERVRAELDILGLDVSRHVVDFYRPMLADIGVTRAVDLVRCRSGAEVLVAGVKVATQTPPIRTGRRVVFLTVDDGSGPADATFFEEAQGPFAATVFHSWLLLVRGRVRRTGDRGVSLQATGAWELPAVHRLWQENGVDGVLDLVTEEAGAGQSAGRATAAGGRRRVLVHASGFRLNVYADVKPAGGSIDGGPPTAPATAPPAKLWHSSPGSSGW